MREKKKEREKKRKREREKKEREGEREKERERGVEKRILLKGDKGGEGKRKSVLETVNVIERKESESEKREKVRERDCVI